jgi:hypothetical protein
MAVLEAETNEILSLISKFGVPVEINVVNDRIHINANGIEVEMDHIQLENTLIKLSKMNDLKVNLKKLYISSAAANIDFNIM